MKRFFLFAFGILCVAVFSLSSPAESGPVKESAPDPVKESESIPEPEKKMVGEWIGFKCRKDIPVFLTRNRYILLTSGMWEKKKDAADSKAEPQGWYKINADDGKLLLQLHEAAIKNKQEAVFAEIRDDNTFVIPDTLDENSSLVFIRKSALTFPSVHSLAGKWKITQMDPESGEKRDAPYLLVLKENGTYRLEQSEKELSDEWAKGTFEVDGLQIRIRNTFSGTGLWKSPTFFLLNGKLRYNDSKFCLWCERINSKKDEMEQEKPRKQDSANPTVESKKD